MASRRFLPSSVLRLLARTRRITYRPAQAAISAWDLVVDWFNSLELSENAVLLGFATVIGVCSALGVAGFYKLIDLAYGVFYRSTTPFLSRGELLAYRPAITMFGLAAAWWIMRRLGRGHDGLNVPDVQLAVVRRGGVIPSRPALARTAASAVTLGGGGSAGSEGPVAVLGAAMGSLLGRIFRSGRDRVTVLVAAGTAAGISAAFNAPLAGAFFAIEEVLGSYAVASFPPIVVSSVVGAIVSRGFFGNHPAFPIPDEYGYALAREVIVFYPLLGILTGVVAAGFVRTYFTAEDWARRWPGPSWALPWIGGLLVGVCVYLSGGLLVGYGHLSVRLEVFGRMAWYALALLAIGKIVATSITLNSGGSGGVFTPSLYVGAATGGAFGSLLSTAFPSLGLHPEAYALVGMGAMVAGATGAPITGILIVFEMTNDYAIMLPLMMATVIGFMVARRLSPDSLYSGWLRRRGEHIKHGADWATLTSLQVADAYDRNPRLIREDAGLDEALAHLHGAGDQSLFPVVDAAGTLVGAIPVVTLGRAAMEDRGSGAPIIAGDIAQPSDAVTATDTLLEAMRLLGSRGATALPVVERETGRVIGLLTRGHILAAYERTLAHTVPRRSDAYPIPDPGHVP